MLPFPPGLQDITQFVVVDYHVDRTLPGGTSDVSIGHYRGIQVAVKKFRAHRDSPEKIKERFLREINTWMRLLATPNDYVPELFGVVNWGNQARLGLVSRYYEHNDAMTYIKSRRFNEDGKGGIFCNIAEGLKHIHNHGVIHGDMTLHNIVFDYSGKPKVTDFGVSRIQGITGFTTVVKGTCPYMAPEIIQQAREFGEEEPVKLTSKAGDVYGLAILAAEIFMEKYHGPIALQYVYQQVVQGNYRPSEREVNSRKYFPLLQRCWSMHASARPDINQIVLILEGIGRG